MQRIEIKAQTKLEEYQQYAKLNSAIEDLLYETEFILPKLNKKKVWMINSTAQGGGVAEMMPTIIDLLRQLGVDAEWLVLETNNKDFFDLTKRIHNLIHGSGTNYYFSKEDREVFEQVNKENSDYLLSRVNKDDIVVIHDPQPISLIKFLPSEIKTIWRCHIGLDKENKQTKAVWEFLKPYLELYNHHVFTTQDYVPEFLKETSSIIYPGLCPLTEKNKELSIKEIVEILISGGLHTKGYTSCFNHIVQRIKFKPEDIEFLYKPTITQISRWDRLKGWQNLIEGFVHFKKTNNSDAQLVLGGPDPKYIQDDPEGLEVFNQLCDFYNSVPEKIQEDIAILLLPMESITENALIVNALQRVSTIIAQNSIQEGFGLTCTEAMYKAKPIIGTLACGLREQIRDEIDGVLIKEQTPKEIADKIHFILNSKTKFGINGEKRVIDNFLVFSQVKSWIKVLGSL